MELQASKNTPQGKGVRTGIQAFLGTAVTLIIGLFVVVWNVPGVPEAVLNYVSSNVLPLVLGGSAASGVLSGIFAYFQNKAGK